MEEVKRIYNLLSHSTGLKIRDIAKELILDKYYVAEIMFSSENVSYWYQNSSSLWFAKEGAMNIKEEPEKDKPTIELVSSKIIYFERLIQENISRSLLSYLHHLCTYQTFSNNEILELFKKYHNGDYRAYDLIIRSHQKLVVGIAIQYNHYGIPLEDIIQEGNLGLIKAVERFDYENYFSFHKYALTWIYQSITFSLTYLPYIVKLPLNQLALYHKICRFKEKYEQRNGFEPSDNEIDIDDVIDYNSIAYLSRLPYNLKEMTYLSDDMDIFENENDTTTKEEDNQYNSNYVLRLLNHLTERETQIIKAYYGINNTEETLSSIGAKFNLTNERVRQIKEKAIRYLRDLTKIKEEEPVIGDIIQFDSTEEKGLVVSINKKNNGHTTFVLKMETGNTKEMALDENSYVILKKRKGKRRKLNQILFESTIDNSKEKNLFTHPQVSQKELDVLHEVNEFEGVKVGDKIIYEGKNCQICNILVRKNSSKLQVKYDDGIVDFVHNDKTKYSKQNSSFNDMMQSVSTFPTNRNKKNGTIKRANKGDYIMYDGKHCKVINTKLLYHKIHLIVMYDNNVMDDVLDDIERYHVIV